MAAILSSLGCLKDYNPTSSIYFQLNDYNENAMPQVFNANSCWSGFINNFHENLSKHSFHMCHN